MPRRLTAAERDRFVTAFAQLNNQGAGRFADFRNMHTNVSSPQAHGAPGFLPWHRAYLLDLERELQAIDPSVALPYWRFDQAAPNLFTPRLFRRRSNAIGTVQFSATQPAAVLGHRRCAGHRPRSPRTTGIPATQPGPASSPRPQTLALGSGVSRRSAAWKATRTARRIRGGTASSSSIGTAAKDPLFFLLHCNVDRLWAKWQRQNGRFDPAQAASYASDPGNPIGHNLNDTMWPWNGITGGAASADRSRRRDGRVADAPARRARSRACGAASTIRASSTRCTRMGFDYDDVRFA